MANTPKTKAEEIAAGVEKEMKRLARESVDTEDVKGLLDSEGETKRRLLNLLKKANKQAKPDTTLIKDIKKNIEAENIHLKKLEAALKDNESFKSRLDKGVAKSRIISEQAAAEPDALSQGTAKLSGKAQTIRVDGAELDSIVQSYAQRMSDVVTKMRALGLPVKEFTAKTTKILDKFIEEINADSGLKGKDKLTQRAKKICLIFAKQHKSNIEKAAGISPVALLVTSLKTKAKQGIADKIKSIPGMGAMDSLARMMGVKTLSEKLTPKGYDQNLAREQRMDSAEIGAGSAEGAQGELEGRGWGGANAETARRMRQESPTETFASVAEDSLRVLERIADALDGTRVDNQETAVAEAKERAEERTDAAEKERPPRHSESSSVFQLPNSFPVPVGEEDKGPGFLGRLVAGATGVAGVTAGATAGTAMGSVAAKAGGGALGLGARVAKGGLGMALRAGTGILGMLGMGAGTAAAAGTGAAAGTAAAGTAAAGGGIMSGIVASLSASLSALGTAITTAVGPLLAFAAVAYILYETWKALDFSAILKPLAKWFGILKDIVMTVGEVIYKILIVGFKMLWDVVKVAIWALKKIGQDLATMLQPVVDALAWALTPIVDAFGWLWEKGLKPAVEWFGRLLDRLINADSIFLELGSILKEGFLSLIRLVWNAIADKLSWVPGIERMEAPETPPGAEDDKTPIPDEPKEEEKKSGSWWRPWGGKDEESPDARPPMGSGVPIPGISSDAYAGLTIKPNAGKTSSRESTGGGSVEPGVIDLAHRIQASVTPFQRFTGFNDEYHSERGGRHPQGLALDFTLAGGGKDGPKAVATVKRIASDAGVNVDVIDEYAKASANATGGHIHAEFNSAEEAAAFSAAMGTDPSPSYQLPAPAPHIYAAEEQPDSPMAVGAPRSAGGIANPNAVAQSITAPGASRNAPQVAAGTAQVATAGAAAPTLVNIGGPSAPAAPSTTTYMPFPVPIRPRTQDQVILAMQSVNQV